MNPLYWLFTKPDQSIADETWIAYLDMMAIYLLVIVFVATVITLVCYRVAAMRRKIRTPEDVFAPFTPLRALWLCLVAGLAAGGLSYFQYGMLESAVGQAGTSLELAVLGIFATLVLSWLCIVAVHKLTPDKFCYRPTAYLHRRVAS